MVLYNTSESVLRRTLEALATAIDRASADGAAIAVNVALGDSSESPCVRPHAIEGWQRDYKTLMQIRYEHFAANLGHGGGHNYLAAASGCPLLMVMNPDIVLASNALAELALAFSRDKSVGIVDAKQLPLEHPKRFDEQSGDTSWCSGAIAMMKREAFDVVGGFDTSLFFMHGDDVDLSWRIRRAGYRAVHVPSAVGFHDKRLTASGAIQPSSVELYHSAVATLLLAQRWGDRERVESTLRAFSDHGSDDEREAAVRFRERRSAGDLPPQLDNAAAVAAFVGPTYGGHRW
jgi:hypothetical protein